MLAPGCVKTRAYYLYERVAKAIPTIVESSRLCPRTLLTLLWFFQAIKPACIVWRAGGSLETAQGALVSGNPTHACCLCEGRQLFESLAT